MQLLRLENASVKSYWKIHCVWNIFAQSLEAPAAAAVPLTSRDAASSVTLVTGREADGKADGIDFRSLADLPGTLAVYMGVEQVARWSRELLAAGLPADTPVTIVSRCSWPDQRIQSRMASQARPMTPA